MIVQNIIKELYMNTVDACLESQNKDVEHTKHISMHGCSMGV